MKQEIVNLILVLAVAMLSAFILLREPLMDLAQRRANEQHLIRVFTDLTERVKKLESKP